MSDAPAHADISFPPFRQRLPWLGPDLQSVAYEVLSKRVDRDQFPHQRIEIPIDDGSGDRLVHHLHLPADDADAADKPTVVMIHGVGGSADAGYMWLALRCLSDMGFPVVRYNRRGCGVGGDAATGVAWHGDTAGIRATTRWLVSHARELGLPSPRVAVLGFSLGGNTLVQWLAQEAEAASDDRPEVVAAATVSSPIDMAASTRCLDRWRNLPYRPYILKKLRDEVLRDHAKLTPDQRDAVASCRCLWDYAKHFNAPRNGFDSAEAYLASAHLEPLLPRVDVPLLMIHSRDDPWVPHRSYEEVDWEACPNVTPLFTDRGGHMGFHAPRDPTPWSMRCAADFFIHSGREPISRP